MSLGGPPACHSERSEAKSRNLSLFRNARDSEAGNERCLDFARHDKDVAQRSPHHPFSFRSRISPTNCGFALPFESFIT